MVSEPGLVLLPDDLSLLGSVFDRAVASLPPAMRTSVNRTEIAKNLMRAAAFGERDPIELELAASKNLVVTAPKEDAALAQVMRRAREWRGYPYNKFGLAELPDVRSQVTLQEAPGDPGASICLCKEATASIIKGRPQDAGAAFLKNENGMKIPTSVRTPANSQIAVSPQCKTVPR